eukprot:CAMPEP_0177766680 /NCGR_PEP_ID=MMETSP0491_2-20121128/8650_1 /TAXON_ID=63592 /ORGANISM="Tetraselmis chuii, Strain PLY429" /LENGTH=510 /DNA_ID=CAMNT_0019283103 /DNA_START=226 /DNA_END=1758 /DNA_ORIENTATION=+
MAESTLVDNGAAAPEVAPVDAPPALPTEKLKRIPKPDETEYNAKFVKLNAEIQSKRARVAEIKEVLDNFHERRKGGGSGEGAELRNKISDEKARFASVLAKKNQLRDQLERINKHRDELRSQAKATKDKNQYMKQEDIDEKMAKLQHKLEHTSLTLNEEKQVLQQLKDLERMRATVDQYADAMDKVNNSNGMREGVIDQLKGLDEEMNGSKARLNALQEEMTALREKENADVPNLTELKEERKECYEVIKAASAVKDKLYRERKAAMDEFYQRERDVKRQMNEERKARAIVRQKEWEERQKERKEREDAQRGEPFEDEIILCDQMASYLQSYLPKEAVPAETSSASISEPAAPEAGMKRVKKKGEGEEEELFSVKGKGGKKGKKGGAKKDDKPAVVKIQHSIDTIAAFGKLKVTVPLATDAVTATIEALKAAKADFLVKRVGEKERRAAAAEASARGEPEEEQEEQESVEADASDVVAAAEGITVSLSVTDDVVTVELTLPVENGAAEEA